jgi:ABC-2 type transport system ATP-binding protein
MPAIIEVSKLNKSYGGKRGIVDVSFDVAEGEVFGFLGPNGAGKTTTIRILMALIRADGGSARIAGFDCWVHSVDIKRLIGYVPGEPALDPNLTGGQILEYFANLRGGVDRAYLKKLIDRFELDTSRKFRQYSTGNKRKVVLIQAFMHRPRVLILDEPTSGLDPLNQQEFDEMVKEAREEGRTVFLSSHVLSEVEKTCTRVGIIREGRLVRLGGVHELKDIKRYEVTITFAQPVSADYFKTVEGVAEVEPLNNGHAVRIAVQGPADAVIKAAARYPVVSFNSYEPSLEDIFLKYYEGDGVARPSGAARHSPHASGVGTPSGVGRS